MKICACICELNPFHNGHEYLLRETRRLTGADYIVTVMSGDFLLRVQCPLLSVWGVSTV